MYVALFCTQKLMRRLWSYVVILSAELVASPRFLHIYAGIFLVALAVGRGGGGAARRCDLSKLFELSSAYTL